MKRTLWVLLINIIGYLLFLPQIIYIFAGIINFDKTSLTVTSGGSFSLQININPGSEEIRSTDIYLSYDSNYLQVESVTEGSYFPTVTSDTSNTGQVYIAGMVDDPAVTKTGTGTLATVNFKAIKDGTTTISFNCSLSKMVKADIDATNILDCSQTSAVNITIGTTTETTATPPTSLPKSGVFENLQKSVKPGVIFLIFGAILRILL